MVAQPALTAATAAAARTATALPAALVASSARPVLRHCITATAAAAVLARRSKFTRPPVYRAPRFVNPAFTGSSTPSSSSATSTARDADADPDAEEGIEEDQDGASSSANSTQQSRGSGPLRDEAIARRHKQVRLVDPKTGSLAGPFPILEILAKLDRTRFRIDQVVSATRLAPDAPPPSATRTVAEMTELPICKLIDKKEEYDRQRALKRKLKDSESSSSSSSGGSAANAGQKEVQLTWSVSENDLSHKLSKAKRELIKGARINVVIVTKQGGRRYVRGRDADEDAKKDALLASVETFLCSAPIELTGDEAVDALAAAKTPPIGRRLGEVDWQRRSAAVVSFEKIR